MGNDTNNKKELIDSWLGDINFVNEISSRELFQIISENSDDKEFAILIDRDFLKIIDRCRIDYDMFNYFTILALKLSGNEEYRDICNQILDITVKNIFSNKTLMFLMKYFKKIRVEKIYNRKAVFKMMLQELSEMPTDKSSIILFDLFIFPDFKVELEKNHRVIATLIECYQLYGPEIVSSKLFNGSTIIGKLLQRNNKLIAAEYLRNLLQERQISARNIQMIGGGRSSLVFKIKDSIIKFGETRNCRKIYIFYRILASQIRKLITSPEGEELFYVEVMKTAHTGDVTESERDELKQDLSNHGLEWEDPKIENCGVLMDDDDNICNLPVDYIEVAGRIDAPYDEKQFSLRKRRVVVIDNDDIKLNPMKLRR